MPETQALQVETVTRGAVPEDAMDLAVLRVRAQLRAAQEPVMFAKIKLAMAAGRDSQAAVAQTSVDLNGRRVRAQAAAATMRAAIESMCERLKVRLERAAEQDAAVGWDEGSGPDWHLSRHPGGRPGGRIGGRLAGFLPQPRRSAEAPPGVVRHKTYALSRLTPDEAIADLEMLDYEFHLFTELITDTDSVVYVTDDGYRIAQVDPRPDLLELEPLGSAVTVSDVRAPRLELGEAETCLEASGRPFMFFVNNQTGRGNLIYHRYDGNYGLITPVGG
jgi:ribosome-associated translation inhibitor RaiA